MDRDGNDIADRLDERLDGLSDRSRVRVLVGLSADATRERLAALERAVGDLAVKDRFSVVDAMAVTASKRQLERLARLGVVERVEEDLPVRAATHSSGPGALNDSAQGSFGVLEARLDAPLLDGNADGDTSAYSAGDLVAAVLDTGIDPGHADLDGGKILGWRDFVNDSPTPYDDEGHGTHVAATIAGEGGGDPVLRGVAPGAGLVGVKVLDENAEGFTSDVVAGIDWVVQNKDTYGIEALNISLGAYDPEDGCRDGSSADSLAVNAAHGAGLVVSVAAGNDGPGTCTVGSPGDAKDALTVGAMADLGSNGFYQADFSSRGPTADGRVKPDVTAPGVDIESALAGTSGSYAAMSGTSMAAPFVTGVALLMIDANSAFTNDDVKDAVRSTAVDWGRGGNNTVAGTSGPDIDYGAGRLDAYAALAAAGAPLTSPPPSPDHTLREGSLSATGEAMEYTVDVASLDDPVAATVVHIPTSCGALNPDFDLRLLAPSGALVALARGAERQDELGYQPLVTGVYRLQVQSFSGCGDFFMDVSGGAVSMEGTVLPPSGSDPGPSDPGDRTPPPPTGGTGPGPVATSALADAARTNSRLAASALRRAGLRRLLRRRALRLLGTMPSAGRLELAVRASINGRRRVVARAIRQVDAAGRPRVVIRLTRTGLRALRRLGAARLTVRAAVLDAATGRRQLAARAVRVTR
ncbi:MAG TPA: S8 family peptidase [Thermoleophilaceae bacterium]|nr:S8 family peptidase [Thermoleophilaceae bacterium]